MAPTKRNSICAFCYKLISSNSHNLNGVKSEQNSDANGRAGATQFLTFVTRFCGEISEQKYRFLSSDFDWPKWLDCCDSCAAIMNGFCVDYHKLKCLELQLEWSLLRLVNTLELSGRIPSRTIKLKDMFESSVSGDAGNCQGSLAGLTQFRHKVIKTCTGLLSKSQPRVLVNRSNKEETDNSKDLSDSLMDEAPVEESIAPGSSELKRDMTSETDNEDGGSSANYDDPLSPDEPFEGICPEPIKQESDILSNVSEEFECSDLNQKESEARKEKSGPIVIRVKIENSTPQQADQEDAPELCSFKLRKKRKRTYAESVSDEDADEQDALLNIDEDGDADDPNYCSSDSDSSGEDHEGETSSKKEMASEDKRKKSDNTINSEVKKNKDELANSEEQPCNIECSVCGETFPKRYNLVEHLFEVHKTGTLTTCYICDRKLISKKMLQQHMRTIHVERTHKCLKCGKMFKTRTRLNKHSIIHKDPETWKYKCRKCGKRFHLKRDRNNHEESHDRNYKCEFCGTQFSTPGALHVHIKRDHIDKGQVDDSKIFQCSKCDSKFLTKLSLSAHMKRVHVTHDHKCSECDKAYKTKRELERHQVIHSGPTGKKFQCTECGKLWFTQIELHKHKVMHEKGPRPVCKLCGKVFANSRSLKVHIRERHKKKELGKVGGETKTK